MKETRAKPPRVHPEGGWYCEAGTGKNGPPCMNRAIWVLSTCRETPATRPGSITCAVHLNGIIGAMWVMLPPPVPTTGASEGGDAMTARRLAPTLRDVLDTAASRKWPWAQADRELRALEAVARRLEEEHRWHRAGDMVDPECSGCRALRRLEVAAYDAFMAKACTP